MTKKSRKKYHFYYDESGHDKKITENAISRQEYFDNFVVAIVGWSDEGIPEVQSKFSEFEIIHENRRGKDGEIKSLTIKPKQLRYGLASLSDDNVSFLSDFISIFDKNTKCYFFVASKIEYLVRQLLSGYRNSGNRNRDVMTYTITKAILTYKPEAVFRAIYKSSEEFLDALKTFFTERIKINMRNIELKKLENEAFKNILVSLKRITPEPSTEWIYHPAFEGFKQYLSEREIENYSLITDKEGADGQDSNTLRAAHSVGLSSTVEGDSKEYFGIRIADMMAGIIFKLLRTLDNALEYKEGEDPTQKKYLDAKWFCMNSKQHQLYKQLDKLLFEWDVSENKIYTGIYSDGILTLKALLDFLSQDNIELLNPIAIGKGEESLDGEKAKNLQEEFNVFLCEYMANYFEMRNL